MIKLTFAPKARPDLTRQQALTHLRERHGPMVADTPTVRTRLKTYIQNYALDGPPVPKATTDRDWIIESWRDETVVLPEPPVAPDAIRLREDEANFPDRTSILSVQLQEDLVWAADRHEAFAAAPIKVFTYLKRRPGLSDEAFAKAWRAAGEALAANEAFRREARRYTQNRCVSGEGAPVSHTASPSADKIPLWDGVDIVRFADTGAVTRLFDDPGFQGALQAYEAAATDPANMFRLVTTEKVVFDDAGIEAAARA